MRQEILSLKPSLLWANFDEIAQVPRTSNHLKEITKFIIDFAERHALCYEKDEIGNIIIRKKATFGMSGRKGLILQAHMDIVGQKEKYYTHDFEKDPIIPYIDGDWVTAKGTTLGSDNGIGMAAILTVLASDNTPHPDLEALFTANEETGMLGASGLSRDALKGSIMINTDSKVDDHIFIGCAGGIDFKAKFSYTDTPCNIENIKAFRITLNGLEGGHSGIDIHLCRANANKLLFRFLKYITEGYGARLSLVKGGNIHNAIPREAEAVIILRKEDSEAFIEEVKLFKQLYIREYKSIECNISLKAEEVDIPLTLIPEDIENKLIYSVNATPDGVERMIPEIPDVVETSSCVSIIQSKKGETTIQIMVRSTMPSRKYSRISSLTSLYMLAEAEIDIFGEFPCWTPNSNSPILKVAKACYKHNFGEEPLPKILHAGVECGIIASIYPKLDIISIGPNIIDPHTPEERVSIPSVDKFWELLNCIIKNIPEK
ncbi:MAG: aminoacyl-histidine dipeptidase [Bacteroidales bacterium]